MSEKLNWGIISTGAIARTFANALKRSSTGRLFAVGSRDRASADAFAREFGIDAAHDSYESLLADKSVDVVYIATPHPLHAIWAIRAMRAGKHVLVEKPASLNHAELMVMVETAREQGVLFAEAFMYRCHPQTRRLVELIRDERAIGEVRVIEATFSFNTPFNPDSRIFKNALGGGGILDIGCYTMSLARLVAGAAAGKPFVDPIDVKGAGHLGATGVDEWATASLRFPNSDIVAQLSTGIRVHQDNSLRVYGSEGRITLPNPWVANRSVPDRGKIIVQPDNAGSDPREVIVDTGETSFTYEADVVGHAILQGLKQAPSPAMSWDDSLGNARALDAWRNSIGLVYESEKPEHFPRVTVGGEPLRAREGLAMRYGRIDGVKKDISRLVVGTDSLHELPHTMAMFDHFFERGGNAFDTAFSYGRGVPESLLGDWMRIRGVREQVVVMTKACHPPYDDPASIAPQLRISLERLGTDYVDVFLLHRDNVYVPVAEFIDALNEQCSQRRIRTFGASNWTLARVEEANAYAKSKGLRGFSLVSNQLSLAKMIEPPWRGCLGANDPDSLAWLERTQTPLLSWSSTARGFFVESLADPKKRDDKEMVRCWYSEENFRLLEWARRRAGELNARPIQIAIAWLLERPFPVFPVMGVRTLAELNENLKSLEITAGAPAAS